MGRKKEKRKITTTTTKEKNKIRRKKKSRSSLETSTTFPRLGAMEQVIFIYTGRYENVTIKETNG